MRNYRWFLEPLDSQTNEVIAGEVEEMNFIRGLVCSDGQRHNLWECPYKTVAALNHSRVKLNLRFKIFVQVGRGKIRPVSSFLFKKRRRPIRQPVEKAKQPAAPVAK